MFNITNGKGFHIKFANGWTVSIQWGGGNYCSNYGKSISQPVGPSDDAEIAAWKGDIWYDFDGSNVSGNNSADDVAKFINIIANKT